MAEAAFLIAPLDNLKTEHLSAIRKVRLTTKRYIYFREADKVRPHGLRTIKATKESLVAFSSRGKAAQVSIKVCW